MADETYIGKKIGNVFAGGNSSTEGGVKVGDAFGPGDCIRIVAGVAYITASGDALLTGVAASKAGHADDVVFTVGEIVEYYPIGQDTNVHMKLKGASGPIAVEEGEIASLSATDGQIQKFAYTDATKETDTLYLKVGRFAEADAGHATEMRIVEVSLAG
jgi:hypothetical protein